MEAGTGKLTKATLSLLQADHAIAGLICLIAHQYDGYIQRIVLQGKENRLKIGLALHMGFLTLLAEPNLRLRLL